MVATSIDPTRPCVAPFVTSGPNDAPNFFTVVLRLVESGFFNDGDILVLDNARVILVAYLIFEAYFSHITPL
jgi:hypothetical protein